ncbi:TIGR01777 family oxidoreductase [Luteolibacter yonseiensis]|uniref:TIGR01777 family oxidoreductase n=1 Tax=Luteolibacter yonseiensis TaxID=1144680 RepID=A0A934R0X6_9BACT|nr:TIGR01777 family oxidoreductase [Luteolibacter yonseiensis]MBK1814722.1 TIGR01777 family oxidoreductase [Luteolibacter yonseiensis]
MQPSERAAIVGVTGFIGRGLPALLARHGMATTGISRAGGGSVEGVDRWQSTDSMDFSGHRAIINLAGERIDRRWTEKNRRLFHESRVGLTTRIVEAIARLPEQERPEVLVNASAVGIYGDRGDEILSEEAAVGTDYMAGLCDDWEHAAQKADELGVRVVTLRIGVVLGPDGPAFEKLGRVIRLGLGGRLGSGKQWMPWVHHDDLRAAISHAVFSGSLRGPVNGSAPHPERNGDFTRKFAAALHRPAIFAAPAVVLRLVLGEFSTALLSSYRVVPSALERDGFRFRYPRLEDALGDLIR